MGVLGSRGSTPLALWQKNYLILHSGQHGTQEWLQAGRNERSFLFSLKPQLEEEMMEARKRQNRRME
jgi:hypothetical protein